MGIILLSQFLLLEFIIHRALRATGEVYILIAIEFYRFCIIYLLARKTITSGPAGLGNVSTRQIQPYAALN